MSPSGRSYTFGHATVVLCLAFLVLGFAPETEIYQASIAERPIYSIQWGTPAAIPNFIDIAAGCNWTGIGGQVFDETGFPMIGLRVKISGTFDGRQVLQYITTGSSQRFGSGGFDLKLGDRPIASQTLGIQLLDSTDVALSPSFVIRTSGDCQQNLLVINMIPISLENAMYLPLVTR